MFPGVSDIFNYLFGTNSQIHFPPTFGMMVAISFVIAAITLRKELKRKYHSGIISHQDITIAAKNEIAFSEYASSFVFAFLLGFKLFYIIQNANIFFSNPAAILLSIKGNLSGGLLLGIGALMLKWYEHYQLKRNPIKEKKERIYPHHLTYEIALYAAIGGVIGAKVFNALEDWDAFISDPMGMLLSGSGLTFYGGLIVGAATVFWYARKNNIPLLVLCDAAAPGLILAYAIGRIGCQLSGDGDWGIVNLAPKPSWFIFPDWAWSFTYPNNVLGEGLPITGCEGKYCYALAQPVFPTPIYETAAGTLIFGILWMIRKKIATPGKLFCVYLFFNGLERFLIEPIRTNSQYHIADLSFTQAQFISIVLLIAGAVGYLFLKNKTYAKR
ncbi:MAG: hypothetical protein RIQ89_830 [Bacteroidota bacterium]|jgi:phosphatidylglycerol---prolipoprotein diacylglyceryl transferase